MKNETFLLDLKRDLTLEFPYSEKLLKVSLTLFGLLHDYTVLKETMY